MGTRFSRRTLKFVMSHALADHYRWEDTIAMKRIIIAAMNRDRIIGKDGGLPWHMPEDLIFFKRMTRGHAVIMGRKTYESMSRPLPRRRNIIVTRQTDYRPPLEQMKPSDDPALTVLFAPDDTAARRSAEQTCLDVVHSLTAAFELCVHRGEEKAFIIGGGQLYAEAMSCADEMILTHLDLPDVEGDTWFPSFDASEWDDVGPCDSDFPLARQYRRTSGPSQR